MFRILEILNFHPCLTWHIHFCFSASPSSVLISISKMDSEIEWKTVQILLIWLHQELADLDLCCFRKKIFPVQQSKAYI